MGTFVDRFSAALLLSILFVIYVSRLSLFACLSLLFLAALWSPAGKGRTSWLSCVVFSYAFVNFPCGVAGQVWYLIVPIPDLCIPLYIELGQSRGGCNANIRSCINP